jgi:hypothetical protein
MDATSVSITGLTVIDNGTPNERGHLCVARFNVSFPNVKLSGCDLLISGNSRKAFWAATSPRRYASAYISSKDLYHAILDAALNAYRSLGGNKIEPVERIIEAPAAITRMCGSSATGAWDGGQ